MPVSAPGEACKRAYPSLTHADRGAGVRLRAPARFLRRRFGAVPPGRHRPEGKAFLAGLHDCCPRSSHWRCCFRPCPWPPRHTPRTVEYPTKPLELATTTSARRVDLTWSTPANYGSSFIQRYEVRHGQGTSVPEHKVWTDIGLDSNHSVWNLVDEKVYTFEVRAVNAEGAGAVARTQATPGSSPGVPGHFTARPGDMQVELSWSAAHDFNSAIVRYEVRHAAGTFVPANTAWTSVGLDMFHTVSLPDNGVQYAFQVRAVNGRGAGLAATVQATPSESPSAPRNLTVSPLHGRVELRWEAPENSGGSQIQSYELRYAAGATVPPETAWKRAHTSSFAVVRWLNRATEYAFEVRAVNDDGLTGAAAAATATPAPPLEATVRPDKGTYRFSEAAGETSVTIRRAYAGRCGAAARIDSRVRGRIRSAGRCDAVGGFQARFADPGNQTQRLRRRRHRLGSAQGSIGSG